MSCDGAHLPSMHGTGFESRTRLQMWVESVIGCPSVPFSFSPNCTVSILRPPHITNNSTSELEIEAVHGVTCGDVAPSLIIS